MITIPTGIFTIEEESQQYEPWITLLGSKAIKQLLGGCKILYTTYTQHLRYKQSAAKLYQFA